MQNPISIALLCLMVGLVIGMTMYISNQRTNAVMKIQYCFVEKMDGSLYHYPCNSNGNENQKEEK